MIEQQRRGVKDNDTRVVVSGSSWSNSDSRIVDENLKNSSIVVESQKF